MSNATPRSPSDLPPPLIRVGTLGAARITAMALIAPARQVPAVEVAAIAARDPERARAYAKRHAIPRTLDSYQALIEDPQIDAIYNPLPNSHHCEWTIRALEAGKHVLCEKPFASNAGEARRMAAAAERSGRVLMEAFHWRYHPLAARMREVVTSGEIGKVRHIETAMCIPLPFPRDIRYRFDLAGGATMDVGAYTVSGVRYLADDEPSVVSARARLASPQIDRWMQADMRFADGRTARVTHSLFSATLVKISARVIGDGGELRVFNPFAPHIYHRMTVIAGGEKRSERVSGDATYTHQLRAFANAIQHGAPTQSDPVDAVANMQVIDAIYEKAGLKPRGT